MATYPGMSLGGEVRESISLDEDDLSDVEDEVFIRDGKNSYKLAEELNVKRPLMAPRRKLGKPDLTSRLKARPPCKAFCKPCCYIFIALIILIGLIVLISILVSIFPLPLDKLKYWVISKSKSVKNTTKLLPCSNLKVTDVWSTNLPVLTTDSPVRILDIDKDGIDDIIFGFGTGDNYHLLSPEIFCPIYLGVPPPCEGGVLALNGTNGDVVWRYWTNDTIFDLHCSQDLNGDNFEDCLAVGNEGSISAIDSTNGSLIWVQNHYKKDVFSPNFIPDQNNDSIVDILSSHTSLNEKDGHLILFSGKTGKELKSAKVPAKTFFMPQLLKHNSSLWVLMGTGSPNNPGNLSIVTLDNLFKGNSTRTLYKDPYKGVFAQSILVDITGDKIPDIVTAMYNSTLVAINGVNFEQIWNYTIPNSQTTITPTPAYFNDDNVTDFLIIYEKFDEFLNYTYTKTFIIDGKTGKPIYKTSINGSIKTQMNGLTLAMESFGFDLFLFWTSECTNIDIYAKKNEKTDQSSSDVCRKQFNTTSIIKLNALNKCDQPPGFEIYNSVNRTSLEFQNIKSPVKQLREYFKNHPRIQVKSNLGQAEIEDSFNVDDSQKVRGSVFRNKDPEGQGILMNADNNPDVDNAMYTNYATDYDPAYPADATNELSDDLDTYVRNYNLDDSDNRDLFNNQKQMLYNDNKTPSKNNRDPRSKNEDPEKSEQAKKTPSKKKNLSDPKYGIYDYPNIKMARNRLLHDLANLPSEILRDTYFKNRESQLRRSKFEQRDITSHIDKMKQNQELKNIINGEKKASENSTYNLWDLESEKEIQDKENGYWRGKRDVNYIFNALQQISSVGAIVKSSNPKTNSIDVVFITYWTPSDADGEKTFEQILNECTEEKEAQDSEDQNEPPYERTRERKVLFKNNGCDNILEDLKLKYPYFTALKLGQMTVYRLTIECICNVENTGERCAKFLPHEQQSWSMYLGNKGDGYFQTRN